MAGPDDAHVPNDGATAPVSDASISDAPNGQTFDFDVAMSCGGCKGAIERVLGKLDGAEFFVLLSHPTAPDSFLTLA